MYIAAAFNRWMRKTARPVVWEGAGAKSPALDPINMSILMNRSIFVAWAHLKISPP